MLSPGHDARRAMDDPAPTGVRRRRGQPDPVVAIEGASLAGEGGEFDPAWLEPVVEDVALRLRAIEEFVAWRRVDSPAPVATVVVRHRTASGGGRRKRPCEKSMMDHAA